MTAAKGHAGAELTTTEAAVLALLQIEGEHSGYDLQKLAAKSIAHVWSPARSGLYAVLPRLEREGLVRSRSVSQSTRPAKQLYTITAAGKDALDAWLTTVEPGATANFHLKLLLGGLTTPDVLLRHLEQLREDVEARLAHYRGVEQTNTNLGHDWYHRHMLVFGIERAEHELTWIDRLERELRRGPVPRVG
jgi:DNA-binding PadR family transcriptional regulator